jgi:hypothetical protein
MLSLLSSFVWEIVFRLRLGGKDCRDGFDHVLVGDIVLGQAKEGALGRISGRNRVSANGSTVEPNWYFAEIFVNHTLPNR